MSENFESTHKYIKNSAGVTEAVPCDPSDPDSMKNNPDSIPENMRHYKKESVIPLELSRETIHKLDQISEKADKTEKMEAIFNQTRDKLILRLTEVGLTIKPEMIKDVDDLSAYSGVLNDLNERKGRSSGRSSASGSVPLSNQQRVNKSGYQSEGYESHEEMIQSLQRGTHSSNKQEARECQEVLSALWGKVIQGQKKLDRPIDVQVITDEDVKAHRGLKDIINDNYRRKRAMGRGEE